MNCKDHHNPFCTGCQEAVAVTREVLEEILYWHGDFPSGDGMLHDDRDNGWKRVVNRIEELMGRAFVEAAHQTIAQHPANTRDSDTKAGQDD